ncbi:transcriptional regulator, PadR family [Lachnospiraceae bacterium KM106-2]|nr:transcriptional regulator, PadR family [Lachnospiraceae bacterium KM106-2]
MLYNLFQEVIIIQAEISSDLIRGHIDTIILSLLCEKDSYGYEIIKSIQDKSDQLYTLKEPSLYTSLKRLEKAGNITSYWGDETQGGRRKYYSITPEGKAVYEKYVEEWKIAKEIISKLIERG